MLEKETHYRKLPGVRHLFANWRLWLAEDHLLLVGQRTFSENYRRFYFTDIESFSICKTTARRKSIGVLLLMAAIAGAVAAWSYFAAYYSSFVPLCIPLAVIILFLARTILLGPACTCQLRTAVQVVDLKSLRRLRAARKVERMILPLIQAAQGIVAPEQLGADDPEPVPVAASRFATPFREEKAVEIRHEPGGFHFSFFLVFFLGVPSAIFDIYYGNPVKDHMGPIFAGVCLILAVIALMKQARSDLPAAVKYLVWAGVLLVVIASGITVTLVFIFAMIDPAKALEHPVPSIHQLVPGPVLAVWYPLFAMASGIISVLGLLRLYKFRAQTRTDNPPHEAPGEQSEQSE